LCWPHYSPCRVARKPHSPHNPLRLPFQNRTARIIHGFNQWEALPKSRSIQKTGLLCTTYEKADAGRGDQTLENLPLCIDLSQNEAETIRIQTDWIMEIEKQKLKKENH
jgi:hypothetical protein